MYQRPQTTDHGPRTIDRPGVVLLVVLVVVVMLSLAAYQYSAWMSAEYRVSRSELRVAQAHALAESGVHYAAALLSSPDAVTKTLNNNPFNNPAFQDQGSDASGPGKFSIIAPADPTDTSSAASGQLYRFGVTDESGKINLNALLQLDSSGKIAKQVLMALPNPSPDSADSISDAILDWLDPDDDPRQNGAESSFYSSLNPPYNAKNGPLDSLEELLLVKGVTPQLLYGNDKNRNGVIDPEEDDGSDKTTQLGWSAYLTVYSRYQDLDSQGQPRINLNDSDLDGLTDKLTTALGQDLANYIRAYRMYGGSAAATGGGKKPPQRGGGAGGGPARNSLNSRQGALKKISSLYDLIDSQVTIPGSGKGSRGTTYNSPLNSSSQDTLKQLLPLLLDKTTANKPGQTIPPRINVNTAPQAVLAVLPSINSGITDGDVQAILAQRPSPSATDPPDPIYQTPAWLITQVNLKAATVKALEKYITTTSQVYRVQSVGYFPKGGPVARIEAVIDTNGGMPRIIYRRDLTELGKGFELQQK